jgi:hypothetical protein
MGTSAHNLPTFLVKPNKYLHSGITFLKLKKCLITHAIKANGIANV